jgi:glycine/D-amino acid oxidase-like deaminating enzyme
MRFTNDHRILIRNNIYYNPSMREAASYQAEIALRHKRLFDERFPMLPEVNMEYTWTGFICLSQNGSPGFGRLADNVYTSVCQNAVGVTKGTAGGMLAADMACGIDNELIGYMQSLGEPNLLPIRPLLGIGVRARLAWELWKARKEV